MWSAGTYLGRWRPVPRLDPTPAVQARRSRRRKGGLRRFVRRPAKPQKRRIVRFYRVPRERHHDAFCKAPDPVRRPRLVLDPSFFLIDGGDIGARMACLSSFYRFLIRMDIVASNPCDALERPRIDPSSPKGLGAEEIRRRLDAIPETKSGLRDSAIVLTLTLTGRRRTEMLSLTRGDLSEEGGAVY